MSDDFEVPALRASRQEIDRLKADLAAHKAALADVVERAAKIMQERKDSARHHRLYGIESVYGELEQKIRSLAPPDAAPYAKVLEAARRYDDARIARPLLYAKKRAEAHSLENAVLFYLHEADEPLAQAQADLHEALAGIGRG